MGTPVDTHLFIDCDLGNSLIKMKTHGLRNSLTVFPHALKYLNDIQFEQKKRLPMTSQAVNTRVFRANGRAVSLGERAEKDGKVDRRTGEYKYSRDYYAMFFLSGLLDILPKGHDNLHVFAGYSPLDVNAVDALCDSLGGRHVIELVDGSKVTYTVRSVRTYQEPIGSLMNWLLDEDTQEIDKGRVLVIDIGGKISSMVPASTDGEIDDTMQGIDLGIQDVLIDFQTLLKANYHQHFKNLRTLPEDRMKDALRTGFYRGGGGQPIDVTDAVTMATGQIITKLENIYTNDFGGAMNFDYALIGGGGGGLLSSQLHAMLQHENTYLAAALEEMHCANLYGAEKMLKINLAHEAKRMDKARPIKGRK